MILIFYIVDNVINNKWELLFIKRTFNITIYNLFIKWLTYSAKYNKFWMGIAWLLLLIASIVTLYVSDYLFNNIDIISDIVNTKKI